MDDGCLKIKPFLLNVGDQITITGILNGPIDDEGITVEGRVAGVDTFRRLEHKGGGIELTAEIRSMIYEKIVDAPADCAIDAQVLIVPKFLPLEGLVPGGVGNSGGISTRFNGTPIDNMHSVHVLLINRTSQSIHLHSAPLVLQTETSAFRHADVTIDGEEVAKRVATQLVEWDSYRVAIQVKRLVPKQSLSVELICSGNVPDLAVVSRPVEIENVQIWRMAVVDDPLGKNILDMQPHILLMSPRIHRKVHVEMPHLIVFWDNLKSRIREALHGKK